MTDTNMCHLQILNLDELTELLVMVKLAQNMGFDKSNSIGSKVYMDIKQKARYTSEEME